MQALANGKAQEAVARALAAGLLNTDDIVSRVARPRKSVSEALGALVVAGFAERMERGVFRLTDEGRSRLESGAGFRSGPRGSLAKAQAPKTGRLRQRAWNAMRIRKRFTVDDLVTLAARGPEKDPRNNLQRYLMALLCGGYLSRRAARAFEGQAPSSPGLIVYRLEKDTGPTAPSVAHDGRSLFDHNLGERVSWK